MTQIRYNEKYLFIYLISISGMQASVFSYVSEFHTKDKAPTAAAIVSTFMPLIFMYVFYTKSAKSFTIKSFIYFFSSNI